MSEGATTNANKPQPRIGSYRLLHSLGSGGMSSVFKAVHVETGHEVAVKVLPRALAKNTTLLQRFIREARSAESLEHPNIVSIFDRGVDQGRHYLVLEFVEGGDLHDQVRQRGPLPLSEAVAAIRSVATGLQYAASRGVIHRDIKPANLLMTPSKHVKIIDLGLALHAESEDERVTREGTTVGTVDYMSPEQARDSRATNEQSDIYSLGCTFYFLLTGAPPFPGGDIADKLSRHCTEPPPDSRKLRPEIPGPLAILVRRMMAKRPENRFANYAELIDELDVVPTGVLNDQGNGETDPALLFALVDEDEVPEGVPAPTLEATAEPLFALVDDSDDEPVRELPPEMIELLEPDHKPAARNGASEASQPPRIEVSMVELAALDDSAPALAHVRRPVPLVPPTRENGPGLLADALLEDQEDEAAEPGSYLTVSRAYDDTSRKLVLTASLLGLGLIVFVIGVHQLYLASFPTPIPDPGLVEVRKPIPPDDPLPPDPKPTPPPSVQPLATNSARAKPSTTEPASPPRSQATWVEPDDPDSTLTPEPEYSPELERRYVPAWARTRIPDRLGGHFVTVQRAIDPRDPNQRHALMPALEAAIGGTIEIADSGPFFEDDVRIRGESLLIRARDGFRPIISIEPPKLDVVWEQPAAVMVDGKNLVLKGIDLIVNVQRLPLAHTALFQCQGGSLTLSDCTITILNPQRRPFALVRAGGQSRPSRVRFESTLVRGASFTSLGLTGGNFDAVFSRSVVVSGEAPLIQAARKETDAESTIQFIRSVLCTRGPLVELDGRIEPGRLQPLILKALGSTFAQSTGEATASLVTANSEEPRPNEQVKWAGDFNTFAGWHNWFWSGKSRVVKVDDLAVARTTWPELSQENQEVPGRWPISVPLPSVIPADLRSLAPERDGTLTRVAAPRPHLLNKTIESFSAVSIPRLAPPAPLPSVAKPDPATPTSSAANTAATATMDPSAERDLSFDLSAPPWHGDLGRFLVDHLRPDDRRIRVLVKGTGSPFSTPIQLPTGLSLEIRPDPTRPPELPPIIWSPVRGSSGEAMIDVRGGDLVLRNVRLSRDGTAQPTSLIRVDGGHLVLDSCWLTAPGAVEQGGGSLITFRATSTEPRPEPPRLFQTSTDRPNCLLNNTLLITGGTAIKAEVGRGFIALSNCAMAVGGTAFDLKPARVARTRFDAGLWIDRCTITAEGSFINLGGWSGPKPGPDRPWLVVSNDSAFLANYERSSVATESILLRAEADSLAHGALAWQSHNDAFDVTHYLARAGSPPVTPRRPDVHRQWVKLWGENHIRNATGPVWPKGSVLSTPSVRFHDRLQSRNVVPADLELDPGHHPGRPRLNVGADLTRLRIELRKRDRR